MTDQTQQAAATLTGAASALDVELGVWLPIETAPKDGTKILVSCPRLGVCGPAYWDTNKYAKKPRPYWNHWGEHIWGVQWIRSDQPTHWQPLPEAPNVQGEGAAPLLAQIPSTAGLGVAVSPAPSFENGKD